MIDKAYKEAYCGESWGNLGYFGVKIMVSVNRELTDNDKWTASELGRKLTNKLQEETMDLDPKTAVDAAKERADIVGLFDTPIYVSEIPNEYSDVWYNKHLPWFVVTTKEGHVKIGWRKRVIEIDWSGTDNTQSAEELFPDENVTKHEQSIHAWSLEDAKKYLAVILEE